MHYENDYQKNQQKKGFYQDDRSQLLSLIAENPLATLVFTDVNALTHISHIPFYLTKDEAGIEVLVGHVSNYHPLAKVLISTKNNPPIQLVFNGDNAYISPNYSDSLTVPTWNYTNVHLQSEAVLISNFKEKLHYLNGCTNYFEREQPQPWLLESVAPELINKMLSAITFFKVSTAELKGRFKLSQNKAKSVRKEIANNLSQIS